MSGILLTKLTWLYRNPWTFLAMTVMSLLFAFIIGGSSLSKIPVPTYLKDSQVDGIVDVAKKQNIFSLDTVTDVSEIEQKVKNGKSEFGLILGADDFQIIVGVGSPNVSLLEQIVGNAYVKTEQYSRLAELSGAADAEEMIMENPAFTIESNSFQGEDTFLYDGKLHPLFGMSLFFVIYTIAYTVFQILLEKRSGVWNRMILSPVRKWEMYAANFLYSFLIGYFQVLLVFIVFRYVGKVDFYGAFPQTVILLIPYVLAIVALSIFLISIVNTVQQFNAVIPIVALAAAMIGGAFWPLEIVQSEFMLALAKFVPITYGMELLTGATIYDYTFGQLLYPISILLFMTVILTGLGIHFMEKRYVS